MGLCNYLFFSGSHRECAVHGPHAAPRHLVVELAYTRRMSANLNLSFEIHDFDRSRSDELFAAAKAFLDAEGLCPPEVLLDFVGTERFLRGYSTSPVIISRSYEWVPEVTARWQEMAAKINGAPCRALVTADYEEETDTDEDGDDT
jgi:hypothetical protein